MKKALVWIVLALLVLGVAFWFVRERAAAPMSPASEVSTTAGTVAPRTFAWRFEYKETTDELPPRTQVALITNGEVYDLGEYAGSCAELKGEQRLEGEVSGVLCWWAGHGDEIGIFTQGNGYSVRLGAQEEGTAETDGFRGDFREFLVLDN